jgi:hypothetical protein
LGNHDFKVEARTMSVAGGSMVVNSTTPGSLSVAFLK